MASLKWRNQEILPGVRLPTLLATSQIPLTPEQRLAEIDSLGVDVHVLSTWVGLYNYDLPLEVGAATAKDCNDYVAELAKTWPQRFDGLATLPMQDVEAAIGELKNGQ
jgi:aminocarboxymuconate-semialdehyde decarboxylase